MSENALHVHPKSNLLEAVILTSAALLNIIKHFFLLHLDQKYVERNFQILSRNHGLTPLEKFNMVSQIRTCSKGNFDFASLLNIIKLFFLEKNVQTKLYNFDLRPWVNPFGRIQYG